MFNSSNLNPKNLAVNVYNRPMGNLFLVATPIGNLADISYRAISILEGVDLILAEDTRRSSVLLKHYSISKPLSSFHEHNEERKQNEIVARLKQGQNIALISDAGTPTLSDPGYKLIRECVKEDIKVVSIPGASAVISALASSGLPTDSFSFFGYVPKKSGKKKTFFEKIHQSLNDITSTAILFESPYRIESTLQELDRIFPEKNIVIARELTKSHEEIIRGKVASVAKALSGKRLKGEITILIN